MNSRDNTKRLLGVALALGLCATLTFFILPVARDARTAPASTPAGEVIDPVAEVAVPERLEVAATRGGGFYSAPAGQVCRFEWSSGSTTRMRTAEQPGGAAFELRLGGVMTTTVLGREDDALVVELSFPGTAGSYGTDGRRKELGDDALIAALASRTLVRMRDDGTTLGYAFADGVAVEHRNIIRGLWSACRFVPRDAGRAPWRTTEDDVVGAAQLEYRWLQPIVADGRVTGGRLQRSKLGYAAPAVAGVGKLSGTGEGEAHFNPDLGWFESAHWSETVVRDLDEVGIEVRTEMTARWQLVDVDWRAVDGVACRRHDWRSVGADAAPAEGDAGRIEVRYRQRLRNTSMEQLLADLARLVQQGGTDEELFGKKLDLVWLLRLRPGAMGRLQRLLPGLDEASQGWAISAIGATELPGAEGFLATLFSDGSVPAGQRQAAAWAAMQVRKPLARTVDAFAAALRDAPAPGGDRGTAAGMLALGAMIGRVGAAERDGAFAILAGLEGRAAEQGALVNWLEALGNAGVEQVLSLAQRHGRSEVAAVRAAAISAVRAVVGAGAVELAVTGLGDGVPAVRARAAEVLAARSEVAAFEALERWFWREQDGRVRGAAVSALVGRVGDARVRGLLERVAREDGDARVREVAVGGLR